MKPLLTKSILLLWLCLPCINISGQSEHKKIAPEVLAIAQSHQKAECIVRFKDSVNFSDLHKVRGKVNKGNLVYSRLKATAETSQKEVRNLLDKMGYPFHSFLINNSIYLKADLDLLLALAERPEVAYIQANPWVMAIDWQQDRSFSIIGRSAANWGLEQINVPEVWSEGIDGAGVVIGGQDTGVEWTHPALKEKYRGWQGGDSAVVHAYNWFDAITAINSLHNDPVIEPTNNPCGLSVDFPCDDNNHGTYTMGISVGDDGAGNQIGVAPGARWIACRNMERGYGSPASYLACFEFFLAPTDLDGQNPRPELAPQVVNNSWSCPEFEGCNPSNWETLENAVNALRAAGIVVVAAAGNSGSSGCASIDAVPAIFPNAFVAGATNSSDTLAPFSSRGPVIADMSNRMKPDVVAPGMGILSARRNGEYMTASGTSAASPFATGVIALIIEANPLLAGEVEIIEQILKETTVPAYDTATCGGYSTSDIPNPMTGYGRIDALAAVQRAKAVSPVEEAPPGFPIRVFPNPSYFEVHFEAKTTLTNAQLEIFNTSGQLLYQSKLNHLEHVIDISEWAPGIYLWRLTDKGSVAAGKIIKR